MNRHLKSLMIVAIAVTSIASCKKDDTVEPITESTCKISQVDYFYNGTQDGFIKFSYDNAGKITSYTDGTESVPYTYTADKISVNPKYDAYTVTLTNGRVTKQEYAAGTSIVNYSYNADGYLTQTQWYQNGILMGTEVLKYTNNNLTSVVDTRANGVVITTTFEFSTETAANNSLLVDPLGDVVNYDFPTNGYYGKLSNNLMTKSTKVSSSGATSTFSRAETYTYTKDSSNKVSSKSTSSSSVTYINGVAGPTST